MSSDLELFEVNTHVFLIKIWLEESADKGKTAKWRGYITHVPSGKRSHFQSMKGIIEFILPYLERLGVRFSLFWRMMTLIKPGIKTGSVDPGTESHDVSGANS